MHFFMDYCFKEESNFHYTRFKTGSVQELRGAHRRNLCQDKQYKILSEAC